MQTNNEIEKLAYEIFEKSGRIPGREMENWFEAESIVRSRNAEAVKSIEPAIKKSAAPKDSCQGFKKRNRFCQGSCSGKGSISSQIKKISGGQNHISAVNPYKLGSCNIC
jgi:hypothetical protein